LNGYLPILVSAQTRKNFQLCLWTFKGTAGDKKGVLPYQTLYQKEGPAAAKLGMYVCMKT